MRFFLLLSSFLAVVSLTVSCQQTQVQTPVATVPFDSKGWVTASNKQLANYPLEGFAYKDATVPATEWDKWASSAAPFVKQIIDKLPDGYVLQVTGHTDSRGPEYPVGDKPGNMKISTDRAQNVYNALRKAGIDSPKLTIKGVGSSSMIPSMDTADPMQRRVTFKVMPK